MKLVSIYTRPPGAARSWSLYCNTPEDGRSQEEIIRAEAPSIGYVEKPDLTPMCPDESIGVTGSHRNPLIDQEGMLYCAIPFRPVEWWKEKANELGGVFQHVLGLPVIVTRKVHFIDNLLDV